MVPQQNILNSKFFEVFSVILGSCIYEWIRDKVITTTSTQLLTDAYWPQYTDEILLFFISNFVFNGLLKYNLKQLFVRMFELKNL